MAGDEDKLVTVTRIIEMHGSPSWINEILKRSFVPLNGTKAIGGKGFYMRGGMVMWSPEPAMVDSLEQQEPEKQFAAEADVEVEQPHRPRFEDTLKSEPNRNAPAPLRVPKPTGVK